MGSARGLKKGDEARVKPAIYLLIGGQRLYEAGAVTLSLSIQNFKTKSRKLLVLRCVSNTMKLSAESSRVFVGGITTQSIRNLLPRSKSSTFRDENTPPNVQMDNNSKTLSSAKTTLDAAGSDPSVKVVVRIRPGNWRERGDRSVVKVSPNCLSVGDPPRTFTFDSVLDSNSTQDDVFQRVGVPLVNNSLSGYNTTILSCGQTGSGKTYTMWGPPSAMLADAHSPSTNQGIVPCIFQMLFSRIQISQHKDINYQCRCSFLEIYNEQIGDLLDPTQRNLQIRDDAKSGFYVENLSEEYVTTYDEVMQILIKGLSNRRMGSTSINSKSSRSHIVFTCVIESWCKSTSSTSFSSSKTSRITLVDIAGSEQSKLDDASRHCVKEGRYVRKSLSHLGHLVHILSEGSQTSESVPYRNSCLTHLLKESLGGNAKLTIICTISPDEKCKGETLSTLRFGLRARSIQNEPVENEITEDDVNDLSDRIRQLKEELIKEKSGGYTTASCNSRYFRGRNARDSLNQLRVSLNRSMVYPRMDSDPDEGVIGDEKDVKELCVHLDNLRSSGEDNFQDAWEETQCFQDASFEETSEHDGNNCLTGDSEKVQHCNNSGTDSVKVWRDTQTTKDDRHDGNNHSTDDFKKVTHCNNNGTDSVNARGDALNTRDSSFRSSLSIMPCLLPSAIQEPTLSESPKISTSHKKKLTSSNLSAIQNTMPGSSSVSPANQTQSIKRSDHIRASLRSSMMLPNPTESLAASLHRGLQIIDQHQRVSASSRSSVALSFEHLALKESLAVSERPNISFMCSTCKRAYNNGPEEIHDSLNMCVVQVDQPKSSEGSVHDRTKDEEKVVNEASKREELEKLCAEQAAKIEQLNLLVEEYKQKKEYNMVQEQGLINYANEAVGDVAPMQDLEKEKHVLLEGKKVKVLEHGSGSCAEIPNPNGELCDLQEERESLIKEIEILRNKLQHYTDVSWIESESAEFRNSNSTDSHFPVKIGRELEEERQRWVKKESEWICLTDELRIDLASNRRHAENVEMELRLEKKVTEELDDAVNRAVLGHARIVEHYADLQDKYNDLLEKHRKIMEGIQEVKRAAAKAGAKGKGSRFAKSLAAELSTLRLEREREREHLKKENTSLRIQLRDTAEAVHAAGELLVRLREAEEAVLIAEENCIRATNETEKVKKQLEKQKRKHKMEMVTMKQYLAESRLPESALRPLYWEDENKTDNTATSQMTDDDQAWRAEFGPAYQQHY